jgi:hypothetical protein
MINKEMKINAVDHMKYATTPIVNLPVFYRNINYIMEEGHLSFDYMSLMSNFKNEKAMLKAVLGEQQTCELYCERNWIWTISNDKAVLCLYHSSTGTRVQASRCSDQQDLFDLYKEMINYIKKRMKTLNEGVMRGHNGNRGS